MYELRTREGAAIAAAAPGTLGLRDFLRDLRARGTAFRRADLPDLRAQALAAGDASALTPDGRLDLRGLDLDDADFDEAEFGRADLSGAMLRRAVLVDAHLPEARLVRADLSGAILDRAEMAGADLRFALLGTAPQVKGRRARHPLRPKADEYRPWDRVLGRSVDLKGADLSGAQLFRCDLVAADLAGARLDGAAIERCDLEGADVTGASLARAVVLSSTLVSPSMHLAETEGAVLRNNTYHAWPGFGALAEAGFHAPRQILGHVREEWAQRALMPPEMRRDMDSGFAIRTGVAVAVPVMAALLWKVLDGAMGLSTALAAGLVSAVMLRRYFATGLRSAAQVALERMVQAQAGLRRGGTRRALAVLLARGRMSEALGPLPQAAAAGRPSLRSAGGLVEPGDAEALDALLGLLLEEEADRPLPPGGAVIARAAGDDWPAEDAPRRVAIDGDGQVTATWCNAAGDELRRVRFDALGFPVLAWPPGEALPRPIADEPEPAFRRRRAAIEEVKRAALRAAPAGLRVGAEGEAPLTLTLLPR